jgi:hypothetical protein
MQRPMPDEGPETTPENDDAEEEQGDTTARPTPDEPLPTPSERPSAAHRGPVRTGESSGRTRSRSAHPGTHRDPF